MTPRLSEFHSFGHVALNTQRVLTYPSKVSKARDLKENNHAPNAPELVFIWPTTHTTTPCTEAGFGLNVDLGLSFRGGTANATPNPTQGDV